MAKDRVLFKEVATIFEGYHPLALFTEGVLYVNPYSIKNQSNFDKKLEQLHDLVKTGPECWQLKSVVVGDYPEPRIKG